MGDIFMQSQTCENGKNDLNVGWSRVLQNKRAYARHPRRCRRAAFPFILKVCGKIFQALNVKLEVA